MEKNITSNNTLTIVLHGGGNVTQAENDTAWTNMENHYKNNEGYTICIRSILNNNPRQEGQIHTTDITYPFYDKLIKYMIAKKDVDPNKNIYLTGNSAGGDGSIRLGSYMSNRFAAVIFTTGHDDYINKINYMNLPLIIKVASKDTMYDRANKAINTYQNREKWNNYLTQCNQIDRSSSINSPKFDIELIVQNATHENINLNTKKTV